MLLQKIMSPDAAVAFLDAQKNANCKIVFTNGVFDVLHTGHVLYLEAAKSHLQLKNANANVNLLVVAINTNASVQRLNKGNNDVKRPLNDCIARATVLAALGCVDVVTWFDENTPWNLIERIKPDLITKGGDYDMEKLPETQLVKTWGGSAHALPFMHGFSTTSLIKKILNLNKVDS